MHEQSRRMMEQFAKTVPKGLKILDVGSRDFNGNFKYHIPVFGEDLKPFFSECEYIGIDTDAGDNVDIVVPPYDYPFPDNHFDIIISGSTLEHVRHPWRWIKEVARVLKVGGRVCIIVPHTHPYHEFPVDCWRVFPEGMRALFDEAGLTEISITMQDPADGGTHPILGKMVLMNENPCADTIGIATK